MNHVSKEGAPAAEHGALGPARSGHVNRRKGMAAPSKGQRRLPSSAGSSQEPRKERGGEKHARNRQISVETNNYHLTEAYRRAVGSGFKSQGALERFNQWVTANAGSIDPQYVVVCGHCGGADLVLCEHFVNQKSENKEQDGALVIQAPIRTHHFWTFQLIDGIKKMLVWPKFDFDSQNNKYLGGFENCDIDDENIIPDLYNHIKVRMQTSYQVNGKEDRALRLAHCQRIMHKWVESKKMNLDNDTVLTNRAMFTVQRVCDNAENQVLYAATDPTANFLLARLPSLRGLWRALFAALVYVIISKIMMAYVVPYMIVLGTKYILPGAVGTWLNLFVLSLEALLSGSKLLCWGLVVYPFSGIGVPVVLTIALLTFLWSTSRTQ